MFPRLENNYKDVVLKVPCGAQAGATFVKVPLGNGCYFQAVVPKNRSKEERKNKEFTVKVPARDTAKGSMGAIEIL